MASNLGWCALARIAAPPPLAGRRILLTQTIQNHRQLPLNRQRLIQWHRMHAWLGKQRQGRIFKLLAMPNQSRQMTFVQLLSQTVQQNNKLNKNIKFTARTIRRPPIFQGFSKLMYRTWRVGHGRCEVIIPGLSASRLRMATHICHLTPFLSGILHNDIRKF
ncbi:hypothetical protein [Azonexus hydrophilus]